MSEARALQDRFVIEGELGRGGMGVVFRARERETGRPVALKIVLTQPNCERQRERFRREGELTARLNHPGVVRVHACGEAEGRPWLAYELVEGGGTLADALRTASHADQARLVRDAARALGAAHALGIVHRDVKPPNLLVDSEGRVRVADFGLATAQDLDRLTQTGALLGTPSYMAPELMAAGMAPVGPPCDVWALGVILYEGLTGRLPFEAGSLLELATVVERGRIVSPSRIDPSIPAGLTAVCRRALRSDPNLRYPDGEAMAADLDRFLGGQTVHAAGGGLPFPRVLAAIALIAVAVIAVGFFRHRATAGAPEESKSSVGSKAPPEQDRLGALRAQALAGDAGAAGKLVDGLIEAGRGDEARRWLETEAKAGKQAATLRLARLLDERGATAQALRWWRVLTLKTSSSTVRLSALLRLAEHERKERRPVAALKHLKIACSLGWEAGLRVRRRVHALVRAAKPQAVRRWTLALPMPSSHDADLGRLCLQVAQACGVGDWSAHPEWLLARRSWLALGFRAGDPISSLLLIRESRRGQFQEEIGVLIREAAHKGRPDGLLALALMNLEGLGCPRDDAKAFRLFRRAAEYPPVMVYLGRAYRDGRGVPVDGAKAAEWFRKGWAAQERGALQDLIRLLAAGRAEPRDPGELLGLVRAAVQLEIGWAKALLPEPTTRPVSGEAQQVLQAAAAGDSLAVLAAAPMLLDGQGSPRDVLRGLALLVRESRKGNVETMVRLGDALRDRLLSPSGYCHWYARAAEAGFPKALSQMGRIRMSGGFHQVGVPPDGEKARRFFLAAKAKGDRFALVQLARLHLDRQHGFKRNVRLARSYLEEAIAAGSREAMMALAQLLLLELEPPELKRGHELLDGIKSSPDARWLRGHLHRLGRGGFAKDDQAARILIRAAAVQGVIAAEWELGKWLHDEAQTRAQRTEALTWIRRAARRGHAVARGWLRNWQARYLPD